MATKDSDFEKRLKKRMEEEGWYVYKIPDKTPPSGNSQEGGHPGRYTTKNRFDFLVLQHAGDGKWWARAIEAKTCAGKRLDFSRVKVIKWTGWRGFPEPPDSRLSSETRTRSTT